MIKIIPVASGKGGVGKSIVALNLATALASSGKTVILADFDLGGATQHLLLGRGVKGEENGLGQLIHGKEKRLENLILATDYRRLHFIPGDSMLPGTHNLSASFKKRLVTEMKQLVGDYLVLDLGAGSSYTVVDFFLTSYSGLIVINPEVTSIMAAYSFLKTAVFRMLYRLYSASSSERDVILRFVGERIEGSNLSFTNLLDKLASVNNTEAQRVRGEINKFSPKLVLNMSRGSGDEEWAGRLVSIVKKKLDINLDFIGMTAYDETVRESVGQRKPLMLYKAGCSFGRDISGVAQVMLSDPIRKQLSFNPVLNDDDERVVLKPVPVY